MVRKLAVLLLALAALNGVAPAQAARQVTFHYRFTVNDVPSGERVRIWFPVARSDDWQEVRIASARGDLPLKKTREARFGNEMYFAEASKSKGGNLDFEVDYQVRRHERLTLGLTRPRLQDAVLDKKELRLFLGPDKLVPVAGKPAELGAQVAAGGNSGLAKARAIYDYVIDNIQYDPSGEAPGRGDALYAADRKRGGSADLHSLFIAMARSQGIPARFETGFLLPREAGAGPIPSYDCWAEFFNPQNGWMPVDISEAAKHPEKKDYFFGAQDPDRIQFSLGRDLKLNPPQTGEPLNYFIYPYVEIGGKEYSKVSREFSFSN
ncbi:MAG: transglutaminase domain-containing protein [Acidobacteria bacterium]|nr:transglutaminase domain-containing protein [Acidobacteriota bacterium]